MTTRSEASRAIGEALETWVHSLEDRTDGQGHGVLGDWIAVVCMVDVNSEGVPVAEYYVAMKDGTMLPHVAHGLMTRGAEELGSGDDGD